MSRPLSMCERMRAVIRGGELDQVPFVQYDRVGAPNEEIWDKLGPGCMGVLRWLRAWRFEHPHCRFVEEEITCEGLPGRRRTLITPAGALCEERALVPGMGGVTALRRHFVRQPADYLILKSYLQDIQVVEDLQPIRAYLAYIGDRGLPLVSVPRTPYQQLWVEWVCIEDLSLHLFDQLAPLQECIELLFALQRRTWEITWQAAGQVEIPFVDFPDNITAPVIGEQYFRQYCLPCYAAAAEMLADRQVPVYVHMDGDLKPLWQAIAQSRVSGLDSFSPMPDNDTTVAQAVAQWPHMRLLVNFPSSVHLADEETIYQQALQILEEGGHTGRLWIQISENTPPGAWVKSYPAILRAIAEFGSP